MGTQEVVRVRQQPLVLGHRISPQMLGRLIPRKTPHPDIVC